MSISNSNAIVAGIHGVSTLIKNAPLQIINLYFASDNPSPKLKSVLEQALTAGISAQQAKKKTLESMYDGLHQGIIAECRARTSLDESQLKKHLTEAKTTPLWLIVDGVQDPHNLGAIFRTALAAGVNGIIAPKDKSVGLTPVVRKVACGAVELLPFYTVTNLQRTLSLIQGQGIWVVGTCGDSEKSLYQMDLKGPTAWVLGAEGRGMRRLTQECCDEMVHIPLNQSMESLNVSVATGVVLFETMRQRLN